MVCLVDATIYHNPKCTTSRKALEKLREAGVEPTIVKYLDQTVRVDASRFNAHESEFV